MKARFFSTPARFGAWLEKHHATESELLVGFWKKHSGKPSMTWPESVDEALRFGWIDGIRRTLDEDSYSIRFTPRKPRSIWSKVNMAKVEKLITEGRMMPAGLAAWNLRDPKRAGVYSFERETAQFDAEMEKVFRRSARAWTFFAAQPPGYRRLMAFYVMGAKKAETRVKRLGVLIERSARGERIT